MGLRCAQQTVILRGFAVCVGLTRLLRPEMGKRPRFHWGGWQSQRDAANSFMLRKHLVDVRGLFDLSECSPRHAPKRCSWHATTKVHLRWIVVESTTNSIDLADQSCVPRYADD
jgi:hypothetical protein